MEERAERERPADWRDGPRKSGEGMIAGVGVGGKIGKGAKSRFRPVVAGK